MLKVTALDLSLFNLQVAKEQLGGLGDVTFVESNAEHMTIENESQDVVTCNFVLSSMPPEAQVRLLRAGGCVDGCVYVSFFLALFSTRPDLGTTTTVQRVCLQSGH